MTSEILASDTEASEANVRDGDSESRLVVVLLQPAQRGEVKFTAGCTLVMTSGQKNKQPMIEVLRTLLQNDENLLRSCYFSRIQ